MVVRKHFSSVRLKNYKALRNFSVSLRRFNILVGPNNSGKSTILGAFRILAEGIRRARARKPEPIQIKGKPSFGYRITLKDLPVSTENVFTNYDESDPAYIEFRLSDGNCLRLVFPEVGICYLICITTSKAVRTPAEFRKAFPVTIGFVPVLGPVEHDEPVYKKEAARNALLTHRASRNFRNIWYHFPDEFDEFRQMIRSTWPGMDIEPPEIELGEGKTYLSMFCPEKRYPREIYWAGFGFQVWCQMLTYAIRARDDSLLVIDEPDIYLHSDLQRQLLSMLEELGPDILIATHSTEIITEAEPGSLLIVNKNAQSAKRLKDPTGLQRVFDGLGSNLNPTLTQLAKSRRALFVEGKDFQILGAFARQLGMPAVANRSDFAVIPVEGFNPAKVKDYSKGIELTLGAKILRGVVFDRDYRSESEILELEKEMSRSASFARIHRRKEIENYVLELEPLKRAIQTRIQEQNSRTGKNLVLEEDLESVLDNLTNSKRNDVAAQYIARRIEYEKRRSAGTDAATITSELMSEFDDIWKDIPSRLATFPGKQLLSLLNHYLQETCDITVSPAYIANRYTKNEVPSEIRTLLETIDKFRQASPQ